MKPGYPLVAISLAAAVWCASSLPVLAEIAVGDDAPAMKLPTTDGQGIDLADVYAAGKTVVVLLRGFPGYQCPICSGQVAEYRGQADRFAAAGVQVVFVYPGPGEGLGGRAEEFLHEEPLPEPLRLALDPDYEFTSTSGLRWDAPNETAYPTTMVVDGGKVTWLKSSRGHGGRVPAEAAFQAATR